MGYTGAMNFFQKHASKATKLLVAGVVLGSVSFGAYGLGRAARTFVVTPKNAYHAIAHVDQVVPYCGGGACTKETAHPMAVVAVPKGKYVVSIGGNLGNTADANQANCKVYAVSGSVTFSYQTNFMTTLLGVDDPALGESYVPIAGTVTAEVLSPRGRLGLYCGIVYSPAGGGEMKIYNAQITAIRVTSVKNILLTPPG